MPERDPMKRRLTWTVYATPLMALTTDLGLNTCLYDRVRETGDWDLFIGPLNGRGQRLVELTDGCYSGGDSQELLGCTASP